MENIEFNVKLPKKGNYLFATLEAVVPKKSNTFINDNNQTIVVEPHLVLTFIIEKSYIESIGGEDVAVVQPLKQLIKINLLESDLLAEFKDWNSKKGKDLLCAFDVKDNMSYKIDKKSIIVVK